MLNRAGLGAGILGLASLLQDEGLLNASSMAIDNSDLDPLAPKKPHFAAKAKRVIWLFINGGPSHVDTWDYKPMLEKNDGKPIEGFDRFTGFFANSVGGLMKSPFKFSKKGEVGKPVSELFPELSKHVDKMAFVHSCYGKSNNHSPALFMANTGFTQMGYPCVGSWATYGLGSESRDLPAFVVMSDPKGRGLPKGYSLNWGAGETALSSPEISSSTARVPGATVRRSQNCETCIRSERTNTCSLPGARNRTKIAWWLTSFSTWPASTDS